MPTKDEHLNKARHNEAFIEIVIEQGETYLDWAVSGYYYATVHYLEAYVASVPGSYHPSTHSERLSLVSTYFSERIYQNYAYLKDRSEEARYGIQNFNLEHVNRNIRSRFTGFKNEVIERLDAY